LAPAGRTGRAQGFLSYPRYRVKRWFSGFGLGADDLQKRADELRGQIRLAKARGDECRCLTCAGVHTFPLTFDENGVCTGFSTTAADI
jgi:hypothetical protein